MKFENKEMICEGGCNQFRILKQRWLDSSLERKGWRIFVCLDCQEEVNPEWVFVGGYSKVDDPKSSKIDRLNNRIEKLKKIRKQYLDSIDKRLKIN